MNDAPVIDGGTRRALLDARVRRVREVMDARGPWTELTLGARRNLAWLTVGSDARIVASSEAGEAAMRITKHDVALLTTETEAPRLRDEELADAGLAMEAAPWFEPRPAATGDARLEDALRHERARLAPAEEERMRWLGVAAADAMRATFERIRPGDSEISIAAALQARLAPRAIATPVILVAADERIARYRHPLATENTLRGIVMVVVVAERWGLHVAMTRMGVFAGRLDPDVARRFAGARQIERLMHQASRPGGSLVNVFDTARRAYADAGFPDEWRRLHLGGTIAYRPREIVASPADDDAIEPGMAFAWNPSIAGAKVEDTLLLTAAGAHEIVTRTSDWPVDGAGDPTIWLAAT